MKKYDWTSMVGKQYGRWNVLSVNGVDKNNRVLLNCKCSCDNNTIKVVEASSLKNGKTISCGCYQKEVVSIINTKYKILNPQIYRAWINIKQRCGNKNNPNYNDYGGRGITICEEWDLSFEKFQEWSVNNGFQKGLEIDRNDFNGNYEPDNCQWIAQQKNKEVGKRRINIKNKSGYEGVYIHNQYNKWVATITHENKRYYIGIFKDINDAIDARISKEIELFGEQKTNFHYRK